MGTHISREDEESIQRIAAAAQPPSPELVEFLSGILGPTHQRLVERRRCDQATGPARDAA